MPLLLVFLVDGRRGVRQTWPVALSVGLTFAVAQFVASNYLSVELTDIVAALAGLVAAVVTLKVWTPQGGTEAADGWPASTRPTCRTARASRADPADPAAPATGPRSGVQTRTAQEELTLHADGLTRSKLLMAFFPYLLIIVVFSLAKLLDPAQGLPRRHATSRSGGRAWTATSSAPRASRSPPPSTRSRGCPRRARCC